MNYKLIYKEQTYTVSSFDFIEDYGDIDGKKCRILYFVMSNEDGDKILFIRLNYPPIDYKKYTEQTVYAIDLAFDKQLTFFIYLGRNNILNLDEELKALPRKVKKYYKILLRDKYRPFN